MDSITLAGIFIVTFLVFWFSPIRQLTDSNYSMLLSESLLHHRSFVLDHYAIPRLKPTWHDNTFKNGEMYQLELVGPHLYYYLPLGSSLLSLPYVAWMNAFGVSTANADGTYNPEGEARIEAGLAGLLMAGLACIIFLTARLFLPIGWSALIALAAAFGTQMWSTASRALWSDTWAMFLLAAVLYFLLADSQGTQKMNPVVVATLLAWSYFVRPTNSISIAAITVYVLWYRREQGIKFLATGVCWLLAFVVYSWYHFHQLLPKYFQPGRLSFGSFWPAFAGNLISPSRGLFIYVPVLLFVTYLAVTERKALVRNRLALLAVPVIFFHLIVVAGFTPWNGGFSYGPRYTTGLVPWFALLAIVTLQSFLQSRKRDYQRSLTLTVGALLLCISVFVNARGAISYETWMWNVWPDNVDQEPQKIWDWKQPQFLAGLMAPPLPERPPQLSGRLAFGTSEGDRFTWYGWSWGEQAFRWTDGDEAGIVFGLDLRQNSILTVKMGAFAGPGKPAQQRVEVFLNDERLQDVILTDEPAHEYIFQLDGRILRERNILTFKLPDAASPKSLGLSADQRRLGIRIEWLELTLAR
ncbi:MAG TPA: hypothetical protein VE135_03330 [Pyrinomonadaceae bacterium]|nr:hypothetical protein [Pyrinomonadaceae bacterium]